MLKLWVEDFSYEMLFFHYFMSIGLSLLVFLVGVLSLFCVCYAAGRRYFREFLRSEYSEENLLFWLACEEMKKEDDTRVADRARIIYEDYISIISPTEVGWLD